MLNFLTKKNKGFTLIELLVVITIIGILAGITFVAVGDSLRRAYDAQRVAEVRQLAFVLERETAIGKEGVLEGCGVNSPTTDCTGIYGVTQSIVGHYFPIVKDPGDGADVCAHEVTGPCRYGISSDPDIAGAEIRTNDFMICFWLEVGAGGLLAGPNSIRTGGRMVRGCN